MAPSVRTMNPEPSPAAARWPERPPKNCSKTSAGTRSTSSVWTVTTEGATRATASVIAVRRDALIWAVVVPADDDCADNGVVEAPWQAANDSAASDLANPALMMGFVTSAGAPAHSETCRSHDR